jgi:transcriptional regulator with XRE-family HTH domain
MAAKRRAERQLTLEVLCLMHGVRQAELALELGVSRSFVSALLNGRRNLSRARELEIAHIIGEPPEEVRKAYEINALPQFRTPQQSATETKSEGAAVA